MLRRLVPFLSVFLLAGPVLAADPPSTSYAPGAASYNGVHHRHHRHRHHGRRHPHVRSTRSE
jgi:hypothetical protein